MDFYSLKQGSAQAAGNKEIDVRGKSRGAACRRSHRELGIQVDRAGEENLPGAVRFLSDFDIDAGSIVRPDAGARSLVGSLAGDGFAARFPVVNHHQ